MDGIRDDVKAVAIELDFDILTEDEKHYFIVCDWYLDIVAMFDKSQPGYERALAWMKEQKSEA